ncbi:type II secretion system protein GspL [Motilimonas pumila]|uniref:type II secretion system protein GspL n=1 Tax=Motilimonas pumila TaxID=2303987 RepID=UPI00131432E3|nr:type II secretion system protein GspL [Motilimonas pumila]
MSERLVIRLGSEANHPVSWLVWSTSEHEIIASGVLPSAKQLEQLHEKVGGRPVLILVPSNDVLLTKVEVPGKVTRQFQQAIPYMLEEELATDVDQLHFSILAVDNGFAHLAIVEHVKMAKWLDWLDQAELNCRQFIPDVLTLPTEEGQWSSVKLEDEWLIRQDEYTGFSADDGLLPLILGKLLPEDESQEIVAHSDLPANVAGEWRQGQIELPMQLLAQGALSSKLNILTGDYKPQKESSRNWGLWRNTGIALAACLVLALVINFLQLQQLKAEEKALQAQIKQVYVQLFPEEKSIRSARIKASFKRHLNNLGGGSDQLSFLSMLDQVRPAFKKVPNFKPVSLRFDANKAELRLQVQAKNYSDFETFQASIPDSFTVKQGAMSNKGSMVTGTLTIGGKG